MKFVLITAVAEFKKDIKQILKKSDVQSFSFKEVTGHQEDIKETITTNWFATEMNENQSIMFYAFVKAEKVDSLFHLIDLHNAKQQTASKVHIVVLCIEKSN